MRPLTFTDMAALIVSEESIVGSVVPAQARRFLARVAASAQNIDSLIEARAGDIERIFAGSLDFITAEQALLIGHAVHPTPKARDELDDTDARRYAPEFGHSFPLRWFAVHRERWLARSITAKPAEAIVRELLEAQPDAGAGLLRMVPAGHALLPAHPWQAARWMAMESVRPALDQGEVIDLGETGAPWTATSSLRTLYAPHAPWMLKFSTSVRLTNSLRTLGIPELERGLLMARVLDTDNFRAFRSRFPRFRMLPEPLYLGLRASDGAPIEETIVAFRENPFPGSDWPEIYVLAALLQDHPERGVSRLAHHVSVLARADRARPAEVALRWFRAYLDVVLQPMLIAQADHGVLVSGHQQNIVVGLRAGYPERAWFRDGQGTAYTNLARALYGHEIAGLDDNIFAGERGNFFFSYSVVINATFNVIASLIMDDVCGEPALIEALRDFLLALRRLPVRDPSCIDYLLSSPWLWSKGNFFCGLRGINEATIDDPLDIYHRIENPLHARPAS